MASLFTRICYTPVDAWQCSLAVHYPLRTYILLQLRLTPSEAYPCGLTARECCCWTQARAKEECLHTHACSKTSQNRLAHRITGLPWIMTVYTAISHQGKMTLIKEKWKRNSVVKRFYERQDESTE